MNIVRSTLILPFLCFCSIFLGAKETPRYVVSNIPAALKENVDIVYWQDQMLFQIHARNRATYKVFNVITILNQNGKDAAEVAVHYDKLVKVSSLRGSIYDADGKLIKKLKSSEIYDQSAYDGVSLFSDNRFKLMNLTHGTYPYTIEYEYELEYKAILNIPKFLVIGEKISSMSADYTVIYPKDQKPRFTTNLITDKPIITDLGNNTESTSWKFSNLTPIKREPFGPPSSQIFPSISCAPSTFEYDGYAGKMDSWDDFGQWINSLNKGRNTLSQETQQKIISITNEFPNKEEKIRAVYEYMQNKTRYVSIQLGIGGYQPFDAKVVDQNGYGDCKALSNYMVSMLGLIGIKSHYVLVSAGDSYQRLNTSFPSPQFNHAIVCVPMERDTIWLECTSQTNPFGYMGTFTGNRKALAVMENGAKVVNTPVYTEKHNILSRNATVKVADNGNAEAIVKTIYSGTQYENGELSFALNKPYEEQKKWVQKNTSIPSFDIRSFSLTNKKERIPSAIVSLDLFLSRFASVSGKRLFITPNLMNKMNYIPEKVENRKSAVVLHNAFTDYDTINYVISDQIYPEFLPEPVRIVSPFGEYEANFNLDQGKVTYTRKFMRRRGEFPASSYQELIDFYKAVNKADNIKLVFLTKT